MIMLNKTELLSLSLGEIASHFRSQCTCSFIFLTCRLVGLFFFLLLSSQYRSIITPVNLIRKVSKTTKAEKASPEIDHDIEQEEDRIQGAPSKAEESQASARSSKKVEKEADEETRDAPVEEEASEEPEEKESEDEFNQIVDPEVEERVLVLTESVDDLRAEFQEFKRVSTIERERLELEVRQAKDELQRAKMAPPAANDDNSLVAEKPQSALVKIASMFSEQFDDEGYMKCMLSN